ncbi:serine/threonine-protein phosphatase [Streptomyces cinnabarinus]|uniref:Serine/threonine-protein phosphatase n=1 Tax=Streptomyces cinnabarinus TaxID=67287 RepID=A0ABY7KT66_9ACTN|nr:PP2C family protein-serine/threonine phosphatase [Streptomyces cinnabarinus]WAZ26733.1 serine/threonine-protein phosphatase [Streptomyces cinnabarinus]
MFATVHAVDESRHRAAVRESSPVAAAYANRARALARDIEADARPIGMTAEGEALSAALPAWIARPDTGLHPLLAAADVLAAALDEHKAQDRRDAVAAQNTLLALHLAFVVVLLLLLGGLALVVWRRIILPLTDLETHLGSISLGTSPATRITHHPTPWLGGVLGQAEHTLQVLKQSQHQAHKDREALRTDAAASEGLRCILNAQHAPGPGVRAHGRVQSAEGVIAGDFLDTLALPGGITVLLQGDVAGHGTDAGLLAVRVKSAVVAALHLTPEARTAAAAAWTVIAPEDERFTTLVIAVLDPARRCLSWLSAGHEIALLRHGDGTVEELEPTGPVIGPFLTTPKDVWDVRQSPLAPGDLIVLATDGLTEARDRTGTMLGRTAVADAVARAGDDPADVVDALYRASAHHDADWNRDDITILAATLTIPDTP